MVRVVGFDIGIINMSFCVGDICPAGGPPVIISCRVFRIGEVKDKLAVLIQNLIKILHDTPEVNSGVEEVLIEQQVALSASRNTSLAAVVFAYYGQLQAQEHPTLKKINFVNPRSKFKCLRLCGLECIAPFKEELATAKGKELKKLAVKMAKILAEHWNCQVLLEAMKSSKKLDDICDSALYAICSQM